MSSIGGATTFKITSTKLYVPIVTLSTKVVYWNDYKSKIETQEADANNIKRFPLDASFQGVDRLFLLAFDNTNNCDNKVERDSHRKYFRKSRYNVLIGDRNLYD